MESQKSLFSDIIGLWFFTYQQNPEVRKHGVFGYI